MTDHRFAPRLAEARDVPALQALIASSIRGLGIGHYSAAQIDAALGNAFGVDSQLIADRCYFVVEAGDRIIAGGGWSFRRTLFGADARAMRDATLLNPATDAARIRAFFVDPSWARRGLGTLLLAACESAAARAGYRRLELMATLSGVALYEARGFTAHGAVRHQLSEDIELVFVPMSKSLQRVPG
jgi:GNAT superfamily N-acetyltransferase